MISQFRVLVSKMTYLFRFYIVESLAGMGIPEATFNEILNVPVEIKQLVSNLPGAATGIDPLTLDYLNALKDLLDGMITKDQKKSDESVRRLYEISDKISKELSRASPYWDECKWKNLFYTYNKDLIAEAFTILTGDYAQALDVFQGLMQTALDIGDYRAEAVIRLLPESRRQIPAVYYNMIKDFRQIGTEWAYLTRFYMVTKIVGLGNDQDVTQKFYELILRIKEKVELILGTDVARELADLLLLYVIRIEELADAILNSDQTDLHAKTKAIYQYSNLLSTYFGKINPYWNEAKWKELFDAFAGLIIEQGYNLNRREYVAAMRNFEQLLYSLLVINDYFASGLYQMTVSNIG